MKREKITFLVTKRGEVRRKMPAYTDRGTECGYVYTVRPGESLYSIGMKFGIRWEDIAAANPTIQPPYIINPGEEIIIPVKVHTVAQGESLYTIGEYYGIDWREIARANDITEPYVIYPGQKIAIPTLCEYAPPTGPEPPEQYPMPSVPCGLVYTVVPRDTMYMISRKFGVDLDALVAANPQIEDPALIYPGQRVFVPVTVYLHVVTKGESLWSLAQRYGMDVQVLASLNNVRYPFTIYIGQNLIIPVPCEYEGEVERPAEEAKEEQAVETV